MLNISYRLNGDRVQKLVTTTADIDAASENQLLGFCYFKKKPHIAKIILWVIPGAQ